MEIALFYHSVLSDWNHGNAHFLRGIASELMARGHGVRILEPHDGWSVRNLVSEQGLGALREAARAFPHLSSQRYCLDDLRLDQVLDGVDLVIAHEWNDPVLIQRLGHHRAHRGGYRLFFHDTHHRSVTAPQEIARYDLSHYDGVLAFGRVVRDLYLARGWARRAWTWHEAADTRTFRPLGGPREAGDLVWVGNWGDDERSRDLHEYLVEPIRALGLTARVYGVRYPPQAIRALEEAGACYGGWLANHRVPEVMASYRMTVHVPRRPYVRALPGIPTIRIFEALACGIPLVCAPWDDVEGLFRSGRDYLVARSGAEMTAHLCALREDPALAASLSWSGRQTILARHTCAHRVDELLDILDQVDAPRPVLQARAVSEVEVAGDG
jgi:spore maturation protein CgeB